MSKRGVLRESLWPRDGRSTAEIDASVREELEGHIERMVEDRVASGVDPDEARQQAVAHFGDVERYAAECRDIDLGDRLAARRGLAAACLVLLATCAYLGYRVWEETRRAERWEALSTTTVNTLELRLAALQDQLAAKAEGNAAESAVPPPLSPAASSVDAWVTRLTSLTEHMQTAFAVGPELVVLPPDEGFAIVREAWPKITIAEVKTGLLKAFAFSKSLAPKKHPRVLQVLHLGMTDADPEIRAYAASYVQEIAHEDFSGEPADYTAWYDKYGDKSAEEVERELREKVPDSLLKKLAEFEVAMREGDMDDAGDLASNMGVIGHPFVIPTLIGGIEADNSYDTIYGVGYFGLGRITGVDYSPFHDGPWWRRWWEKHKSDYPAVIAEQPIPEFPKTPHGAAYEPVPESFDTLEGKLRYYTEGKVRERSNIWGWAEEVAKHKDASAIPFLIAAIEADNTSDTVYGIGHFGLRDLTGVRYDDDHDGAWWRAWWEKNKASFPADAQAIEIPDASGMPKFEVAAAQDDLANVSGTEHKIPGNDQLAYVEIESNPPAAVPADGYKLLLILPGGDGSRNFTPFVKRIYKYALNREYVVGQLIAPQWAGAEECVWPTAAEGVAAAEVATEKFIAAAVDDIAGRRKIDRNHVFAMGWSSGGPAVYAAALVEEPVLTASMPVMSVFYTSRLPSLEVAKDRAFYILHSPQDQICPYVMATEARDALKKNGATVEFVDYEGGHGWRGDVFGNIRAGVQWMEQHAAER